MVTVPRFTSANLESLPDDGKRYEIIDGELFVSKAPGWHHQQTSGIVFSRLFAWCVQTGAGEASVAPGLVFGDNDDVIPDVVWVSRDRLAAIIDAAGHLRAAPDLVVEVLSPGSANEERDRDFKLKLYSRRGVREYWIMSWQLRQVEVYRREAAALQLVATLYQDDLLESPILPGFSCRVAQLFG